MLPEELFRQVRELQIRTGRAVNEVFAGEYTSAFKGRGMEFAEVREYQPGDDIRSIDWNVTARTGTPHVKRFVEERELTVIVAADMSASGAFGSVRRAKRRTAAELSAVLAFAARKSNDKVGLLLFTDRVELYIPPKKGSNHTLRVIRELLNFTPEHTGTDIAAAMDYLARVLRRRAVIFLISDFLIPGASAGPVRASTADAALSAVATPLSILNRRHDLITVRLTDPRERSLGTAGTARGLIDLRDAETGSVRTLDLSSAQVRRVFEALGQRRQEAVAMQMRRLGVDHLDLATDEPYIHALVQLFRRRERRR
ncbi:MAG: DUF58 domain-containing protein [Phycisphaerales bacterium]|nr:DUF58 domain-containing protein [Phycisphaerales bacterium]